MKLIDKNIVLSIIDKFMYDANLEADIASTGECFDEEVADAKYQLCKCIKERINSLEVKEVDLENIAAVEWDDYIRKIDGEPDTAYMLIKRKEYIELAKHFFTLGLPVSEELEKVAKYYIPDESYHMIIESKEEGSGENVYDYVQMINMFKAGANWKEQQMMAKVIDAQCFGFQGTALFSFRLPSDKYLVGSKVKVIVIKEN